MTGVKNLTKLLRTMSPVLCDGEFVFCTFEHARYGDHAELRPVVVVKESEGLTLVVPKHLAEENGLNADSVFSCITLQVHSSLDAVGLTAALATKLGQHGISANVVAGYYHDHIFVQAAHAEKALAALSELRS